MTDMTHREAAEHLGVTRKTITSYIARHVLFSAKPGTVTRESVAQYDERRDPRRRAYALMGNSHISQRKAWESKIYNAILNHLAEGNGIPVYEDIAKAVSIAKSGISRFMPKLIEKKLVEVYNHRIYPVGLREKIAKIVKEEYGQQKETETEAVRK